MNLKLVKIVDESPNVKSFFWEPEERVNFIPGQYFYYTLPKLNYDDPRGATRHFTISSSPTEGNLLRLTTKFPNPMSGFKKTLLELKVGDEIEGRGPQGTFTMLNAKSQMLNVYISGGIGITPFRSMIKYNFDKKLELPYLIYSNSDENFVFGNELKSWLNKKVEFVDTSKFGHINAIKINELIKNFKLKIKNLDFYIVGPPKFTNALEEIVESLGVQSGKIETEKFTGY